MAVAVRGGDVAGTIFHTDRGSEYTADLFAAACSTLGITQSMGRAGSCFDNAAAESFFSTLEWELFRTTHFDTKQAARREVARFIDWYNRIRRHSSCEMKPPDRVRGDPRRPGGRNGPAGGGGVKTGLHDRLRASQRDRAAPDTGR